MSEGVEWAVHCCTVLAALPKGQVLPAAKLAEFHDVPRAYLAKHLQSLAGAGLVASDPGPRGGYRLSGSPAEISLLDVVLAVEGEETAFRCSEIRQRGPASAAASSYRRPCGIARAMWRAEDAWRRELAATSIAEIVNELLATVPARQLARGGEWIQQVAVNRRRERT